MSTGADFERRFLIRADELEASVSEIVRKAALQIDQLIVKATPVDVGTARSNWLVSLDSPRRETIPAYVPGEKGSTGGANAQAAVGQAKQVTKEYKAGKNSEIWIVNNLPYIALLNTGTHSRQADPNFVETAVLEGVQYIKANKKKVFR